MNSLSSINRITASGLMAVLLTLAGAQVSEVQASGGLGQPESFETIARGAESGYRTALQAQDKASKDSQNYKGPAQSHETLVIDNADAWRSFWQSHSQGKPYSVPGAPQKTAPNAKLTAPAVDFGKDMVLAIFLGRQQLSSAESNAINAHKARTGVKIREIRIDDHDHAVVYYDDFTGTFKTEATEKAWGVARPYHIVKVRKVHGNVEFSTNHVHDVENSTTLIFALLLIAMIVCLALEEQIHAKKSIITGSFAILCLLLADAFHLLPLGPVINDYGERLNLPVYITAVDWEVIAIILGSSIFVDVTSRSGIFTWIAIKLTKHSGGDPSRLLIYYGIMTVVFSAVLNNVTAMIIVGSLTGVSLRKLERTNLLLGFLLIEGLLTNIGGLLTLISSVPNIIVGNTAGIGFSQFFIVAAPYVVFATTLTLVLGARLYEIAPLATDEEREQAVKKVAGFDENDGIKSQRFFNFSAVIFILFIAVLATTSNLPILRDLNMGFVAFMFAMIMLLQYKSQADEFYSKVDWDLIAFFGTLFVVINVMEHARVLAQIGKVIASLTALGDSGGSASLLWGSAISSSVTDNIPLAAMLAKILDSGGTPADSPFWWSVILGANLGGNLTPIGSASTVVAVTVMAKNDVKLSFGGFVKAALPFALLQLVLATVYVLLINFLLLLWALAIIVLAVAVFKTKSA